MTWWWGRFFSQRGAARLIRTDRIKNNFCFSCCGEIIAASVTAQRSISLRQCKPSLLVYTEYYRVLPLTLERIYWIRTHFLSVMACKCVLTLSNHQKANLLSG